MKNIYIIKSGKIHSGNNSIDISFGLVHYDDGLYTVDTYFQDSTNYTRPLHGEWITLTGKTDQALDIEIQGLSHTRSEPHHLKTSFVCHQFLKVANNNESELDQNGPNSWNSDNIFLAEIEGLDMQFADYTELRKYKSIDDDRSFSDSEFDHTSCVMRINDPAIKGNYYHLLFYKSSTSNNIIVDFRFHKGYNQLSLGSWELIRHDFTMFLSFINGGRVFIRKEFRGKFYTESAGQVIDAQEVLCHSREEIK